MIYFLKLTLLKIHFLEGFFYLIKGIFYLTPIFLILYMISEILEKFPQITRFINRIFEIFSQLLDRISVEKPTAPIPIQENPSDSISIPHTQNESFLGKWSRKWHKNQ